MSQDELYIRGALTKAFLLGQAYWQQADSEYASQWKKADATREEYNELLEEVAAKCSRPSTARIRLANPRDCKEGWTLDHDQIASIMAKAADMSDNVNDDVVTEAIVCALIDLGYLEQPEKNQ